MAPDSDCGKVWQGVSVGEASMSSTEARARRKARRRHASMLGRMRSPRELLNHTAPSINFMSGV